MCLNNEMVVRIALGVILCRVLRQHQVRNGFSLYDVWDRRSNHVVACGFVRM